MRTSARRLGALAAAVLAWVTAGCGNYADFTLPEPAGPVTAASFRWNERPAPVLSPGAPGQWDGVDVLNPSVAKFGDLYYNLYSGFDGKTWCTGLATSPDRVSWTKQQKVLSPDSGTWEGDYIAANGALLVVNREFLYWYQAGRVPNIGLARSPDGRGFTKLPEPVLRTGPRGSWDERGVADPYVIRAGGNYYMFYLGLDRARRQRLGVARSPDGIGWRKLRRNPILELGPGGAFDEKGLGEPAVWISHGRYWMLYTGRDRGEHRRIGLARSRNGVDWEKVVGAPVFEGGREWDSKVVCDPAVETGSNVLRVWFGGGDVASPDENLHGQIGFALLDPVSANLSK